MQQPYHPHKLCGYILNAKKLALAVLSLRESCNLCQRSSHLKTKEENLEGKVRRVKEIQAGIKATTSPNCAVSLKLIIRSPNYSDLHTAFGCCLRYYCNLLQHNHTLYIPAQAFEKKELLKHLANEAVVARCIKQPERMSLLC